MLDLLAQLYDAVLEPERFPAVMQETISHLRLRGLFFAGFNPSAGLVFHFLEGVPEPTRATFLARFLRPEHNPFARVLLGRAPLDLVTTEEVTSQVALPETDFYRELLEPSGLHEFIGAILLQDAELVSPFNAFRSRDDRRFDATDRARLQSLLPHYRRAAQLLWRFSALKNEQRAGQDVLDRLPYGVFLLDGAGRVTACNRAAEEILRRRDGLALMEGKLQATRPDDCAALDRMVADAALTGCHKGLGSGGALTVERAAEKPRYEVLVSPCGAAPLLPAFGRPTAAVVFVTDRDRPNEPDPALLRRMYGLTPTEAKVACGIATGNTPAEVARALGVGLNTVRTHLYRALAKTGTERQADLVRLLTGGPLGLRQAQPTPRRRKRA
jgi:DNA-binding CsgD family transcriptional regulator/PAS domain-containing protein